jgi:hypothetical protein
VNAAAIAAGDMGASGGMAFLSPSMVEKRQSRKQGVELLVGCAHLDQQSPPLCFCTAWMTRASTQDWFTVRFVSANFYQQLLSFSLVHST